MSRIVNLLIWICGAVVALVSYALVSVYVFGEVFDGHGKLETFGIWLYWNVGFVVVGFVGYAAASLWRPRSSNATTILAGVAFSVLVFAAIDVLGRALPNAYPSIPSWVIALLIGALSTFVARRNAA